MDDAAIIDVRDLYKKYGDFTAVDGISFKVARGEVFGILGPNGAGKTTTIRMMYGFLPMSAGQLNVFGLDIVRDWRQIRARTGICHQDNNADPDLSVRENLQVFARYFGISKAEAEPRIDRLLKFTELDQRSKARISELSGGMLRRLILARSLLNNPELIILDEPTTGLDPQSRHVFWDRLRELKRKGVTILMTTHYMDEAAQLCDRLIIIDHGRILVEGKPRELVEKYVGQQVIESSPVCPDLHAWVEQSGLAHEVIGDRLFIYGRDSEDLFREVTRRYCKENCILRTGTLEDVFLKLTGRELRE